MIDSTRLLSTKETTLLRRNQTPCLSSHAASASSVDPSFILMIACSAVAPSLPPVAIGPRLTTAGSGVAAAVAGLAAGLASASAGLAVSVGDAVSLGGNCGGATTTWFDLGGTTSVF